MQLYEQISNVVSLSVFIIFGFIFIQMNSLILFIFKIALKMCITYTSTGIIACCFVNNQCGYLLYVYFLQNKIERKYYHLGKCQNVTGINLQSILRPIKYLQSLVSVRRKCGTRSENINFTTVFHCNFIKLFMVFE